MQVAAPTTSRPTLFTRTTSSSGNISELNAILQGSSESAWKRCRPGNEIKVFHVLSSDGGQFGDQSASNGPVRIRVETCRGSEYPSLSSSNFNITVVPIVTGMSGVAAGVGMGQVLTLQRLFRECRIPESALSTFLDNRIHFARFPVARSKRINYQLCLRQWALCWSTDEATQRTNGLLLWLGGSWSKKIAEGVEAALRAMDPFPLDALAPGLLASILCLKHQSACFADNDEEAFRTERRLREVIHAKGALKYDEELGRLTAAHSWLGARSLRDRVRTRAIQTFLSYALKHHDSLIQKDILMEKRVESDKAFFIEPLQLIADSLYVQTSKLYEESSMHMSILHNLTAQRGQALNLTIAAASKEIALQSKLDQTISLEIAESSKKIAEESKRDSTAMKIIAIMTMLYLPATFLASCFSMPLFSWSASGADIVNPRIWIYFASSALLTVSTATSFAVWLFFKDRKDKRAPEVPKLATSSELKKAKFDLSDNMERREESKLNCTCAGHVQDIKLSHAQLFEDVTSSVNVEKGPESHLARQHGFGISYKRDDRVRTALHDSEDDGTTSPEMTDSSRGRRRSRSISRSSRDQSLEGELYMPRSQSLPRPGLIGA